MRDESQERSSGQEHEDILLRRGAPAPGFHPSSLAPGPLLFPLRSRYAGPSLKAILSPKEETDVSQSRR